jgi:hypothetical protein
LFCEALCSIGISKKDVLDLLWCTGGILPFAPTAQSRVLPTTAERRVWKDGIERIGRE